LERVTTNTEYINVEDALRRIGGNMDLYKRLLGRFIAGNNIEELETALQHNDMEASSRLAHTLKGVSANLSLSGIRSASIDLEQAIKDGVDYSSLFENLKQVYNTTVELITEMIK
jgi:HPt (histidine-containing phosphotransfer) domain-containing protein